MLFNRTFIFLNKAKDFFTFKRFFAVTQHDKNNKNDQFSFSNKNKCHCGILFFLTAFFFLLEISFFILCNKAYLDDFSYVSGNIHIPFTIVPGILYFLLAQCLLHVCYTCLIAAIGFALIQLFSIAKKNHDYFLMALWLLGVVTILTANQFYFPYSKFSELTQLILVTPMITQVVFYCLMFLCSLLIALTVFYYVFKHSFITRYAALATHHPAFIERNEGSISAVLKITIFFIIFSSLVFFYFVKPMPTMHHATVDKPNVIIIGMDSVRPDFLSYFGGDNRTPNLDRVLNTASVFTAAITPLARTFPSWTGILTGKYPKHNGVRFDLALQTHLDLTQTLPAILQRNGYRTVFATDETRFSNIDKNFGFDTIAGPRIGLNDFLIGTFNDFPLSNLIVNTIVGKWLFPYSYGNRAAYITYQPNTFLNVLQNQLFVQDKRPLFLAVHFCLPHLPYLWADTDETIQLPVARYAASVRRVDQQVGDFFNILSETGYLDHAIVVLLSDHGEAIEMAGDRITESDLFLSLHGEPFPHFYPANLTGEKVNESAGHGTDVLGLTQHHSVLAVKLYHLASQRVRNVGEVVSLLDVKPTILDLLKLENRDNDGRSLIGQMVGDEAVNMPQHLFLESDFSPEAIRTVYPNMRQVMLEGIQVFQIDPMTTRLTVKPMMGEMIVHSKQMADIYGDWILALYPQDRKARIPVLVNLKTGYWTTDLSSDFAQKSPAKEMLKRLHRFFQNELS